MFSSRMLTAGLVILALSGTAVGVSIPAQAGESTGTWRNGMVDGPYGPGWYGPDGTFYDDDRYPRRRIYLRERHRPWWDEDVSYAEPYARPYGYRWRERYDPRERRHHPRIGPDWESGR